MTELIQKNIIIDGKKVSYWEKEIDNPKNIYVLLAPGAYSGKFFKSFENFYRDNNLYIAPDFPARGESDSTKDNSIDGVSQFIVNLLIKLKISEVDLVAFSFGTQIAIEIVKREKVRIKKIILVAPGEYFDSFLRKVLLILFKIFSNSIILQNFIRKVILYFQLIYIPDKNLEDINEQWISTLEYKLPTDYKSQASCILVDYDEDQYVTRESKIKVKNIFEKSKTYVLQGKHPSTTQQFISFFENIWTSLN